MLPSVPPTPEFHCWICMLKLQGLSAIYWLYWPIFCLYALNIGIRLFRIVCIRVYVFARVQPCAWLCGCTLPRVSSACADVSTSRVSWSFVLSFFSFSLYARSLAFFSFLYFFLFSFDSCHLCQIIIFSRHISAFKVCAFQFSISFYAKEFIFQ